MVIEIILLILGLGLLIKGADFLIEGSSALAKRWGVSNLVIGLTIVSFGTSLPELIVSVFSAIQGNAAISLGNVVGSNISNILLILGITALVAGKLFVANSTVTKEIPFALLAAAALITLSRGGVLSWPEGLTLLLFFCIFLYYIYELMQQGEKTSEVEVHKISKTRSWVYVLIGTAGLWIGGHWVVDSAVSFARLFGLSEYLISVTIIAVGTSLPELVASVRSALDNKVDLAVGNVVGSNIFNSFWILGVTPLIADIPVEKAFTVDLFVSLFAVVILLITVLTIGTKRHIERYEGAAFVLMYAAYIVMVILRG
jgi:cation:H+ antiporter